MTVIIPCREADQSEVPSTAKRLAKVATEHGWTTQVTYAKADPTGEKVVESVAVRLRHDPLAAYGLWVDGKFHLAYVWSRFSSPRKLGSRDLSAFVKAVQ